MRHSSADQEIVIPVAWSWGDELGLLIALHFIAFGADEAKLFSSGDS